MKNSNGKMLIALLTSAAIGAGVGILYAPYKGRKTRKKIRHAIEDTKYGISDWFGYVKDEFTNTLNDRK